MAIKELFYDNRPQVLLDPRASQRIDPRFKFTRNATATYVDRQGIIRTAQANQPRFESSKLLIEPTATNASPGVISGSYGVTGPDNANFNLTFNTTETLAPDGTNTALKVAITADSNYLNTYVQSVDTNALYSYTVGAVVTLSFYYKPGNSSNNQCFIDTFSRFPRPRNYIDVTTFIGPGGLRSYFVGNGWYRVWFTGTIVSSDFGFFRFAPGTGAAGSFGYFWGPQIEENFNFPSSYIYTTTAAATRAPDLLSVEAPLPTSGSVYIDARAITANENDTLLSLKNSSNDKIDLAYLSNTSTYNSLALIANYDGTSKTSLPLPVPTTDRERNIITWGAQNYQYGRDSSRFAPSLSSSVPTGLNKLSIGHDAVDPTKAFNGYINTVYAWSGELTPAVAEALVRNDLDPINADTYSPTGPVGSLALVINTQGATASGDKTFTLPAESAATDNDIVITWGDGTESGLDGADAEVGASGLTHTYPAAGIYPVWVEGQMENIYYNNIANANDLLQIATWGTGDMFTAPSTMNSAFYGCTQMDFSTSARFTNRPDTSAVTDWYRAFRDCSSITGTFPAFTFTAATTFQEAWQGCSSMTTFVAAGNQTQNVTNFASAWYNCSSLTAFPQINTSSGTNFSSAWRNCSSLTTFPVINTAAGTNFSNTWSGCSDLESFSSSINTAAGTNFSGAWSGCSSLDNIVNAAEATSFPVINTAAGTNFSNTWSGCSSFTNFPQIATSNGENFNRAWAGCSSLASFPQLDTSEGTNFAEAWNACSNLNNIGVVAGATTSFPLINTSKGTTFNAAWLNCSSLTTFPANFFDSWIGTPVDGCFYRTWDNCFSLTPASVVNILNSIAASGQSAPSGTDTGDKEITIDWDGTGDPATDAAAAITTLKTNGWDVVLNGVSQ